MFNNSDNTLDEPSDSSKVDPPVIIPNKVKTADKTKNEPKIKSPTEHQSSKVAIFLFCNSKFFDIHKFFHKLFTYKCSFYTL